MNKPKIIFYMYLVSILGALLLMFLGFRAAKERLDQPSPLESLKPPTNAFNGRIRASGTVASITKYLATGNPMANGEAPYIGAVAISDRTIPLNSQVAIEDGELSDGTKVFRVYDVKDRTALWVHERNGLTIDIYTEESEQEALQFGRQTKSIIFLD